jgi:hypothetical protein
MSTNLSELPTNPTSGGNMGGGISMNISEQQSATTYSANIPQQQQQQPTQQQQPQIDSETINKLISGLQTAAMSGSTKIQSRDIPRETLQIIQDPEIIPTYIPQQEKREDYISNNVDTDEIIQNYNRNERVSKKMDDMYDEIHIPLLVCMLFFIFQLPFFKKFLLVNMRFLFNEDCNYNLYGFVFSSVFFSMVFYCITLGMKQI